METQTKNGDNINTNVIYIFNPKEQPFGKLSNNAHTLFTMDRRIWKTVTHYIYSNMLQFTNNRTLLDRVKTKEVYNTFLTLYNEEKFHTIVKSVNEAHFSKFNGKVNPELEDMLISTDGFNIVYNDDNTVLGVNSQGEGYNAIGKSLTNLRQGLINEKILGEKKRYESYIENKVYNIYKAYAILERMMSKGFNPLPFKALTPEELIVVVYGTNPIASNNGSNNGSNGSNNSANSNTYIDFSKFRVEIPDIQIIMELYRKNKIPWVSTEIENPGTLISNFIRKNISIINDNIKKLYYDTVLGVYLSYIINKNYNLENDKYELAKREELDRLTPLQLSQLKKRVYYLYKKGLFNELEGTSMNNISVKIDEELEKLPKIISKDMINIIKNEVKNTNDDKEIHKISEDGYVEPYVLNDSTSLLQEGIKLGIIKETNIVGEDTLLEKMTKRGGYNNNTKEKKMENLPQEYKKYIKITPEGDFLFIYHDMPSELIALTPGYNFLKNNINVPQTLEIFNRVYPNVLYYILFSMLVYVYPYDNSDRIFSPQDFAYNLITEQSPLNPSQINFKPYDWCISLYNTKTEEMYIEKITNNCYKGMDAKFKDTYLQKLLLSTGDKELVYTDRDLILGIGKSPKYKGKKDIPTGLNIVGKYLMILREKVSKEIEFETSELVPQDITYLITDNLYFKAWADKRISDLCNVYNITLNYVQKKIGIKQASIVQNEPRSFSKNPYYLLSDILNTIYDNCGILLTSEEVVDIMPKNFGLIVNRFCPLGKIPTEGITSTVTSVYLIWSYIYKLLYYLYRVTPSPKTVDMMVYTLNMGKNEGEVIVEVSEEVTNEKNIDLIIENTEGSISNKFIMKYLNEFIIKAIFNIIIKLHKILEINLKSKKKSEYTPGEVFGISNIDISTAFGILLGQDLISLDIDSIKLLENMDTEVNDKEVVNLMEKIKIIDDNFNNKDTIIFFIQLVRYIKDKNVIKTNELLNRIRFFI